MNTCICTQTHTNICLGAQTHTHVTVCLAEETSACMLVFCCTLEIIARTLHKVVNRVRLYGHHTQRGLCSEVHVYGVVMRRWGEGGNWFIDSVLIVS